jgi:hypothetical protein
MSLMVAVPTGSYNVPGDVGPAVLSRLKMLGRANEVWGLVSCLVRLQHAAVAVVAAAVLGTKCGFAPLDQR